MEMIQQLTMAEILSLQWVMNIGRYFLFVGGSYLLFWRYFKKKYQIKLHRPRPQKASQIKREITHSLKTMTLFLIPTFLIIYFSNSNVFKIYFDFKEGSTMWYIVSYLIVFFLHDTYFYWTHRLMHHPKLYKHFHSLHHKSIYPTPFAAFSFNTAEAMVESFFFVIIALILPIHISVILIFALFSLIMNIYGHLGMDILPLKTQRSWPFKYINHPTHHSWHHRHFNGNFGFYLKFWDKLMGTWKGEFKDK